MQVDKRNHGHDHFNHHGHDHLNHSHLTPSVGLGTSSVGDLFTNVNRSHDFVLRQRENHATLAILVMACGFEAEPRAAVIESQNDSQLTENIIKSLQLVPDDYDLFDMIPGESLILPKTEITIRFGPNFKKKELHKLCFRMTGAQTLTYVNGILGKPRAADDQLATQNPDQSQGPVTFLDLQKPLQDQGVATGATLFLVPGTNGVEENPLSVANILAEMRRDHFDSNKLGKVLRMAILSPSYSKALSHDGIVPLIFNQIRRESCSHHE